MFRKKNILLLILLALASLSFSQTIKVKKETARIKNEYADGFEVELQASTEEAQSSLTKFMKTFGKTKQGDNFIVVNEPVIHDKPYTTPLYAVNKQLGNIVSVWIGIKTKEWGDGAETINRELESLIHDFGVNFHREKIQKQIDESIRASQAVDRQLQRLSNQNKDLNSRIEDNKREKIQLEKSIANNKTEMENLIKRLEKNKLDQDSVSVAGEQIKKAVEMHKERQRKVN